MYIAEKKNSQISLDSEVIKPDNEQIASDIIKQANKKNLPLEIVGTKTKKFIGYNLQVAKTLEQMADLVDNQNRGDPSYSNMGPDRSINLAYQAACDLIFKGSLQPNGYTEPTLHHYRLAKISSNL